MNLQSIIERRFKIFQSAEPENLSDLAAAEEYIKQSYESRYIFELIQNARDAAVRSMNSEKAFIKFILYENALSVSNSGEPFNEQGINDICSIGRSQKKSAEFIGHKGLGFKAVKEISDKIKIVTFYGSLIFDKNKTLAILSRINDKEAIPLFSFPHFENEFLTEEDSPFVTCINMSLREDVSSKMISDDFKQINPDQLVLLGNIQVIEFKSKEYNNIIEINKRGKDTIVTSETDDHYYVDLSPKKPLKLSNTLISKLEKNEKNIFKDDPLVEFKIIFRKNKSTRPHSLILSEPSNFYLFYPLEISSGFRFLIHSYFTVTPDRKSFRKSALNRHLLKKIAYYIGNDLVALLKKHYPTQITECLFFEKNNNWKEDVLVFIDEVKNNLKDKAFIYCNHTKLHFKPNEVILCKKSDFLAVFEDGIFSDKHLVQIENEDIFLWLQKHFDVLSFSKELFKTKIESICNSKLAVKDIGFFKRLYLFLSDKTDYSSILKDSKILYTNTKQLVDSKQTVFLSSAKSNFDLPSGIQNKIYFLYPDLISTAAHREWENKLGISAYSTRDLATRLINLLAGETEVSLKSDILNTILRLCFSKVQIENEDDTESLTHESVLNIVAKSKKNIQVPCKHLTSKEVNWVNPLYEPVYFPNIDLMELYPNGKFLETSGLDQTSQEYFQYFFKRIGVWDIPAIYLKKEEYVLLNADSRKSLTQIPDFYKVYYDRYLDVPESINDKFTKYIITNFSRYSEFIQKELYSFEAEKAKYRGYHGNCSICDIPSEICVEASHFGEFLKTKPWIYNVKTDSLLQVSQAQGITRRDRNIPHYKYLDNIFNLIEIELNVIPDMSKIGLCHFKSQTIENFIGILNWFYNEYKEKAITKEIKSAYNFLLSAIAEALYEKSDDELKVFSQLHFLCFDEFANKYDWKLPEGITYIDKRPFYNKLDNAIKAELQPQFTSIIKTGFGKMAKRLGAKPMNVEFNIAINQNDLIQESDIKDYFDDFAFIIALLESKILENKINIKDVETIIESKVLEVKDFQLTIRVNNSHKSSVSASFFTYKNKTTNRVYLYILSGQTENKIEIILDYLSSILERDLEDFSYILKAYYNGDETLINDIEIKERCEEINAQLSCYKEYELFWFGILLAKGFDVDEIKKRLYIHNRLDFAKLAELLQAEPNVICKFDEHFTFTHPGSIEILKSFFLSIGLSLNQYNRAASFRLSYKSYFADEMSALIFRTKNQIKSFLYDFCLKNAEHQEEFYSIQGDHYDDFRIPSDLFELDTESEVEKYYQAKYPYVKIKLSDIKNFVIVNYVESYEETVRVLKEAACNRDIHGFLIIPEYRSKCYFSANHAFLKSKLDEWLVSQAEDNLGDSTSVDDDYWNELLKNKALTAQQPVSVDNPVLQFTSQPHGGGGGNGEGTARQKNAIGAISERIAYEFLKRAKSASNVKWVSKNAERAKVTQLGDDSLGYDIVYDDIDLNKEIQVEVKTARIIDLKIKTFEISYAEISHAIGNANYKIFLVTNPTHPENSSLFDIGNIFYKTKIRRTEKKEKCTLEYKNYLIHIKT